MNQGTCHASSAVASIDDKQPNETLPIETLVNHGKTDTFSPFLGNEALFVPYCLCKVFPSL